MKRVCFPVVRNEGVESVVFEHFGSAPHFVMVDTEKNTIETLKNMDLHHQHGQCNPMKALGQKMVDAVVVGGIGGGALRGLQMKGIKVFKSSAKTVRDNLELFKEGRLQELSSKDVCEGHVHGHLHMHKHGQNCCGTEDK
ncbi:MAG: NifB/NifX family molybdenum-iron cluster-binding protein [Thermodesulfovibrionales bacterium]